MRKNKEGSCWGIHEKARHLLYGLVLPVYLVAYALLWCFGTGRVRLLPPQDRGGLVRSTRVLRTASLAAQDLL